MGSLEEPRHDIDHYQECCFAAYSRVVTKLDQGLHISTQIGVLTLLRGKATAAIFVSTFSSLSEVKTNTHPLSIVTVAISITPSQIHSIPSHSSHPILTHRPFIPPQTPHESPATSQP